MFCVINVGKKISRREGVYSTRNSQLIEKFLVRGISSVYVIMGSSEHDRKKMTLFYEKLKEIGHRY